MRNILLTISYDGTDFCGWQRQDFSDKGKSVRTVQGCIEDALEKLHGTKVALCGSGRTDSGVHARAQAANFFSPIDSIPAEKYVPALNSFLPDDIRIMAAREVDENFSSRYSATSRTYRYFIAEEIPLASEMRYVWHIKHNADIKILNEMASLLKGEINFETFRASGDKSVSSFRYVENAEFFRENGKLIFQIEANAFLWKMVRSITGSLIFFERTGKDSSYFEKVLKSRERKLAGPTAPPQGLFLWSINFDGIRRHV